MNVRELPLDGRAALVTGVSRVEGIGFAVTRHLAGLGARIVVHGLAPHDATQLGKQTSGAVATVLAGLRAADPDVVHLEADLAAPAAASDVVAAAVGARGPLDILVCNHARSSAGSLDEVAAAEFDLSLAVNARSPILLVQAFAAQHRGDRGGPVVLMTSGQHLGGMPSEVACAVSKGAIHQARGSLAR